MHCKQLYFDIERKHYMEERWDLQVLGKIYYSDCLCFLSSQFFCVSLQSHFYTHHLLICDEFLLYSIFSESPFGNRGPSFLLTYIIKYRP